MNAMQSVSVSELRLSLAAALDRVDRGERLTVTRDGEPVAVLLSPDDAAWSAALADRFRDRLPPFSQAALDEWIRVTMARLDVNELLGFPDADSGS